MMKAQTWMTGLAVAGLVGGGAVVAAGPASADTCPKTRDVSISGGESHYTISCSGGNVYVSGWLKDTKADGKCVQVKAQIGSSTFYSNQACPSGEVEYFGTWSGGGNTAYVYTYTI